MRRVVLLGCGFVGIHLLKELEKQNFQVFPTSRDPDKNQFLKSHPNKIRFDINEPLTYQNIPDNCEIIWLFPAKPLAKVIEFYNFIAAKSKIRIVLGTTSSYLAKSGIIDESSELDLTKARVQGENFLLSKGAVILALSGIYNKERHPFSWLNKGLIKNSNKSVNLIHINDISKIILEIMASELSQERFNVSDGVKYWWKDIWKTGNEKGYVFAGCPPESEAEDRLISNNKLRILLGNYKFENFNKE